MTDESTQPHGREPGSHSDVSPSAQTRGHEPGYDTGGEAPERIGRYRLIRKLGEGGMGAVYEAEQDSPRRSVALKIIRPGLTNPRALRRFEFEAQLLGRLQHPGIAQVFEAGATDFRGARQPYFAMELVRGRTLTDYALFHRLSARERLKLLAAVCDAVHHAHQKGVIHRDLKPANILVSDDAPPSGDGLTLSRASSASSAALRPVGQPKILDFGVARLTDGDVAALTLQTSAGELVGTVAYMSPEQVEGASADLDTRSDVYALGVVGYELIAGRMPYELTGTSLFEATRVIREVEPLRLTRVKRGFDAELEVIFAKSLEKEKERRYQSAFDLAADVRRYLADEPILARRATAGYQLRKFAKRNKALVGGALAAVVALAAGLAVATVGLVQARRARDGAESARVRESQQRRLAEANQAKAEAVNQFLLKMLGSADLRKLGRNAKVVDALHEASQTVATALADQPEVEAGVRKMLADTYLSLGLPDDAAPHLDAAVALATRLYGETSLEVARCLHTRGSLLLDQGKLAEAVAVFRAALAMAERLAGPDSTLALGLRGDYALALRESGRVDEAEQMYRETLERLRARPDTDASNNLLVGINSLAVLLHHKGQLGEAEALYREAVERGAAQLGSDHPDQITAELNLASVLRSRGSVDEAEHRMRDAGGRCRRVFGENHEKTAVALRNLADLLSDQGRFREALPLYEETVAVMERVQGDTVASLADAQESLALARERLGDSPGAVAVQRLAVETRRRVDGPEARKTIQAVTSLANYLDGDAQADERERMLRWAMETAQRTLGDSPITAITINSLALALHERDRIDEAEPLYRAAVEMGRRVLGEDDRDTLVSAHNLMAVLRARKKLDEAKELGLDLLPRFDRAYGPRHPSGAVVRVSLGRVLDDLGQTESALRLFLQAVDIRRSALGERNPAVADGLVEVGLARLKLGALDRAQAALREAVELRSAALGEDAPATATARSALGACLTERREFDEAATLLHAAYDVLQRQRGPAHRETRRAAERLARLCDARGEVQEAASWRAKAEPPLASAPSTAP